MDPIVVIVALWVAYYIGNDLYSKYYWRNKIAQVRNVAAISLASGALISFGSVMWKRIGWLEEWRQDKMQAKFAKQIKDIPLYGRGDNFGLPLPSPVAEPSITDQFVHAGKERLFALLPRVFALVEKQIAKLEESTITPSAQTEKQTSAPEVAPQEPADELQTL